jgi:glycosyltransferase involved in cell wall biosynthesis
MSFSAPESSPLMSTTDRVVLDRAATRRRSLGATSAPVGTELVTRSGDTTGDARVDARVVDTKVDTKVDTTVRTTFQAAVVIATYNRPGSVAAVLADLAGQVGAAGQMGTDNDAFEVIVINDGGAVDVASEVATELPFRVRLIERPNGGPAQARHSGILHTQAPIVIVVDDDMRIDPHFVASHVAAHHAGAEVVYGTIATAHAAHEPLFTRFHNQHIERWLDACRQGETPKGELLCTGNVSFRRNEYVDIGGFDQSLVRMEDRDLGIRFEERGLTFAFAPGALTTHRSDHTEVNIWRARSRVYGSSDLAIAQKYPQRADLSPWAFLSQLPLVVHPLLVLSACVPAASGAVGAATYGLARVAERVGRRRIGIKLAGLTYGIDYYSGVGRGWGSWRVALAELKRWKAMTS